MIETRLRSLAVTCIVASILVTAQDPVNDPYAAIPAEHRALLRASVNRMIDLQMRGRWTEIYELLPSSEQTGSPEEFALESTHRRQLVSFEPAKASVSPTDQSRWLILGCGAFKHNNATKRWQSVIFARLDDSKWSVSTVLVVGGEQGPPKPCDVLTPAKTK
jgi:hypothetical protein